MPLIPGRENLQHFFSSKARVCGKTSLISKYNRAGLRQMYISPCDFPNCVLFVHKMTHTVIDASLTPKMADCLGGILMTQPERMVPNEHKQSSSPEILDYRGKPRSFISWLVVSWFVVRGGFGEPSVLGD